MNHRPFVPDDFTVPRELVAGPFRLEPLGPRHNAEDHAAWTSSIEHIRATPGFQGRSWPPDAMTTEENLADLRRHADDFARRTGFTYTVIDVADGTVVGCVYIYPPRPAGSPADGSAANGSQPGGPKAGEAESSKAESSGAESSGAERAAAQVSSWVRADRAHFDEPLHRAVSDWLVTDWPFVRVSYAARPARS